MLTPRLTNCPECADIPNLLKKIDCKLAEYANDLYNNISFMLNRVVPARAMIQLLAYKRILTYKACNPDYLADFCLDTIVSKVIRLTSGCYIKPIFIPIPTTTTTSTSTTCTPTIFFDYRIDVYTCSSGSGTSGNCVYVGQGSIVNSESLTISKWYYYEGFKYLITELIQTSTTVPDAYILDSTKEDTCQAVICPTTTTTSTSSTTTTSTTAIPTTTTTTTVEPNTFNVTNNGSGNYVINGESNPTLNITEGQTYTFNILAIGHPFWINTVNSIGTGNAYNDGVTNNGTDNGTITFVVAYDAPSTLYYNCQFHSSMAGTINVTNVITTTTTTTI